MLNSRHRPKTSGNSVKSLFEQKMIRNLVSREKSSGRDDNELPVKSSISKVSAKSRISLGKWVKPQD
jgi:hypothetical protein